MKRKYAARTLLLPCLVLMAFGATAELNLPKAPDGYEWVKILNDKSALLRPDGWFYREDHLEHTDAYFVSKENIAARGKFSTGLSLNIIYRIEERKGVPPSKLARSAVEKMRASDMAEVLESSEDEASGFVRTIGKVRMQHPEGDMINHFLFLANDQTGTLWYYNFESLVEEWDDAWKIGTPMLRLVVVDSNL